MILGEVGLEVEYWLLDKKDQIMEAPKYNFPADEMGFLIEIRSAWGKFTPTILGSLGEGLRNARIKANLLDLEVVELDSLSVTKEWQDYIAKKYDHQGMTNHTRNIYGLLASHHTGFVKDRATAGCHVHFSRWDTETESFLWFNEQEIELIVQKMDKFFAPYIKAVDRVPGEWEPKQIGDSARPHGFEYRSLPASIPKGIVVDKALEILREVKS